MSKNIEKYLNAEKIDISEWEKIAKTRHVDYRTNYIIVRIDENEDKYDKCRVDLIDFSPYDAVIISDYNKGFLSERDIAYIAEHSKNTFLDTKKILGPWCEGVSYVKINDVEYERTKHKTTPAMIDRMIITTGPDGCIFQNKTYPVPKVEIKDTAGAGDTFIAALAVEYVRTGKISQAIEFANECATLVVQKKGVSTI